MRPEALLKTDQEPNGVVVSPLAGLVQGQLEKEVSGRGALRDLPQQQLDFFVLQKRGRIGHFVPQGGAFRRGRQGIGQGMEKKALRPGLQGGLGIGHDRVKPVKLPGVRDLRRQFRIAVPNLLIPLQAIEHRHHLHPGFTGGIGLRVGREQLREILQGGFVIPEEDMDAADVEHGLRHTGAVREILNQHLVIVQGRVQSALHVGLLGRGVDAFSRGGFDRFRHARRSRRTGAEQQGQNQSRRRQTAGAS